MTSLTRQAPRVLLLVALAAWATPSFGALPRIQAKPEAMSAFERYVSGYEKTLGPPSEAGSAGRTLTAADLARARKGGIAVHNRTPRGLDLPDAQLHHWEGVGFLAGASLEEVLAVLKDYDRHKERYEEVVDSRLLSRQGDSYRYFLKLRKKKIVTAVLNTEHEAEFVQVDANQWLVSSRSTRIAEVEEAGTRNERELPAGNDSGFLWRLNAYWRVTQETGGVLIALETISLSRDVPFGLQWLIGPIIESLPGDSLKDTLEGLRKALRRG
jgi:hypothetical protein